MKKGDKKWYQSVSNWIFLIACIIFVPIILMNLSIMMQAKKNKDAVPSVFGIKPFMVLSGSMETEIQIGDLILTRVVDPSTLKVNDVIAFRDAENTVTTHRIIDIVVQDGETYFITKGDNNNAQDRNLVEYEDVEGIYIGRIPGIGSIMKSLSEPTTILIIVVGITIIFVIGFTISNRKQRELERQEFLEYKRLREQDTVSPKNEQRYVEEEKVSYEEPQEERYYEEDEEEFYEEEEQEEVEEIPEEKYEEIESYSEEIQEEEETPSYEDNEEEEFRKFKEEKEKAKKEALEEEIKRQEEKERQEFLEYKRMKEEEERRKQEEKERQEFLEFKRYKEQLEREKQQNSSHDDV